MFPMGVFSARLGLTANFWTAFSLVLAGLSGWMLYQGRFFTGLVFAALMSLADVLDGATARASNTAGPFGTVLDHTVDRYAEFFLLGGLLIGGWISAGALFFCATGMIMASYVRAKAESAGGLEACLVGITGRAEKLALFYIALGALGFGFPVVAEILVWGIGALSHFTAAQRLFYTRAKLRGAQ
ncbi:MAG TPA: CDP-alcohol phosphatidyltransferase family protein [Anaerolineales bacterium]|nr:CDP-alcohol phosphatidyltransferase family protein [Anaerolineales bacterium]